jgi:hypothetical protein
MGGEQSPDEIPDRNLRTSQTSLAKPSLPKGRDSGMPASRHAVDLYMRLWLNRGKCYLSVIKEIKTRVGWR